MSEAVKAQRAIIAIGDLEVEGFMLPDGSYRMSQAQAAQSVGKPAMNASRFLGSKAIKALLGEGYTDHTPEQIEIEASNTGRGQSRFNALSLEVVTAYWVNQASQGNKQAISLVMAIALETLERRFDSAFGIERSEEDYNRLLASRVQSLETDLNRLGEGFAADDDLARENAFLRQLLQDNNIDPYSLGGDRDP